MQAYWTLRPKAGAIIELKSQDTTCQYSTHLPAVKGEATAGENDI